MQIQIESKRKLSSINPMIYGQFIEHFHRQIYGGVYDPGHPAADAEGFRTDVLEAMRKIKVPVLRWPGGCLCLGLSLEGRRGEKPNAYV